ncbi:MAG TPA: PEGA domain-containing protein [Polyangia bacterium]|nr:PEGA domain-containing protein [Polyangia bacterium]
MRAIHPEISLVFTLGLALLVTPAAWGQTATSEADAAISKGVELRRQGKNEEALEEFQKAFRLVPSPRAKAQIALAEQAIGRWADAERDLADALREAGDPWIARQRAVLTDAMSVIRRHLGGLTVKGEPAGAVVELDGEAVGVIPLPERHVTAGEVVVTVRAPGYVSVTRKVTVTPGELAAEVFRLKRLEGVTAAVPTGAAGSAGDPVTPVPTPVTPANPPTVTAAADQPAPSANPRLRTAAWASAAGGGAFLAAGVTFLLLGQRKVDSFKNDNTCDIDDRGGVTGGSHCQDLYDSWHTDRTVGIVGVAVGGALAVTSAVLFVTTQPAARPSQALAGCGPGAGRGVSCVFRF